MTATTASFTARITFVDYLLNTQSARSYTGSYAKAIHWLEQARMNCSELLTATLVPTPDTTPTATTPLQAALADLRDRTAEKDLTDMLARNYRQAETTDQWAGRMNRRMATGSF